ncbi:MAG: hypothetical protein JJ939_02485 [Alphaproteobacteria bacterium]|jgi:hypothetical protein|nr:hypothetical protein [Alphaproteobacteria bacterium]MBO6627269.1 hypothetical protein [Alphaproteobacteria bacterium]MDF1626552.1 hypothetical protein [Parvibaculaceae bacterium]|tara:strand:+ start:281 stop:688 length:408 start_codon:yes stop_codon:yes gene_type:complete
MFTEFMDAWAIAQVEQDAYVAALPQWVQLWMNWMILVLGVGAIVFSIFKVEARWLLLAMLLTVPATMMMGVYVGWNGLWGLTHILLWPPVVIYMARRLSLIEVRSVYGAWYVLALGTMVISLIFDIKDVGQYLLA